MTRHECVTRDSRVASQGVSRCPDPTRPDPTLISYDCMHPHLCRGRVAMRGGEAA